MSLFHRRGSTQILFAIAFALPATELKAALVTFDDRPTWEAAVGGPIETEDLNGFASDTQFRTQTVHLLNMTIRQENGPPANGILVNQVDAAPFSFGLQINGSPQLDVEVGGPTETTVRIGFVEPVTAWGAEEMFANGPGTLFDVYDTMGSLLGTSPTPVGGLNFWGVHMTEGETIGHIIFRAPINNDDLMLLDDLSFVRADSRGIIPEPTALTVWSLFGLALACVSRRWGKAETTH